MHCLSHSRSQPQPAAATDGPTAPLVVEQLDVFTSGAYGGTDDYHTFRIPSLVVSPRGTLLTIVEGRKDSRGDLSNVHLVCKRSDDGGRCVGLTPGGPTQRTRVSGEKRGIIGAGGR